MNFPIFTNNITIFLLKNEEISKNNMTIYLTSKPSSSTIEHFVRFMKDKGVTDIFCFCEPSYESYIFRTNNIYFHNLEIPDGCIPTNDMLKSFNSDINEIINKTDAPIISFYCHSGLGRAPTMLAYLMITKYKWNRYNAIQHIRHLIHGSINGDQLKWILESTSIYKSKHVCTLL